MHLFKRVKSHFLSKVVDDLLEDSRSRLLTLAPLLLYCLHILQSQLEVQLFQKTSELDLGLLYYLQRLLVVN